MKVLLISAFPPTKHNVGVPSALPFYLAEAKPAGTELHLMYYKGFEKKEQLFLTDLNPIFSKITTVKKTGPLKYYLLKILQKLSLNRAFQGNYLHYIPSSKIIKAIEDTHYDLIWLYPNMLFNWYKALSKFNVVMTGPDCSYLHYRLVSEMYKPNGPEANGKMLGHSQVKNLAMLKDFAFALEKKWSKSNALIHVVGKDDLKMYEYIGALNHSFFSNHPHYIYRSIKEQINDAKGKLTVLISGVNHSIYHGNFLDRIVAELFNNIELSKHYKLLFLGKGFEDIDTQLLKAGYETTVISWVDSYEELISNAHIQLFPIILGTGTKGKVLSALATGLLAIGTKYAFENIDIANNCITVDNEVQVVAALNDILRNKSRYTEMASISSEMVKTLYAPAKTGADFWNYILNRFALKN